MNEKKAYCQNSQCMKVFKREKGEVLSGFITCSKDCEEFVVKRNLEFLLEAWREKYYVPTPAILYNNNISFINHL